MESPRTEFTCGLCGASISGRNAFGNHPWLTYYRAIYCRGSRSDEPRLSGLACRREAAGVNYLPAQSHQRFDDSRLDPQSLITIHHVSPLEPDAPEVEKEAHTWGYQFHDSCWKLLEQACAPRPVDLKALWRILLSVPHVGDIPNWGHNYGGLYRSSRRVYDEEGRFFYLGSPSGLLIPSVYHDPFRIPELDARLARRPVKTDDKLPKDENSRPITASPTASADADPFSRLPVEIREMILIHMATQDILSFRLSSRAIAATGLSNFFFQSRFWNDREVDVFFDGFLLNPRDKGAIDWKELYISLKGRLNLNLFGLGERNRLRIWKQTVQPLTRVMDAISCLSSLNGKRNLSKGSEDGCGSIWKGFVCIHYEVGLQYAVEAEILVPISDIEVVHVSLVDFFGTKYVSGLRFTTWRGNHRMGYILPGCEVSFAVESKLWGFSMAFDQRGIFALAVRMGQNMESEYLTIAGEQQRSLDSHLEFYGTLLHLRASFDVRLLGPSLHPRATTDTNLLTGG
jgi:hypothetical protein